MKNTDIYTLKKKSKTLLNILVIFTLLSVFSYGKDREDISYYDNGNIKQKITYKDDKRNGETIRYDETGKVLDIKTKHGEPELSLFHQITNQITNGLVSMLVGALWYLIPICILVVTVVVILKSTWSKGDVGELKVNLLAKLFLDKEKYHLVKNVTLPTKDGSTQIDHVIVSRYGVFVVETKNIKGWIFGSSNQKTWTQQIYKHKNKFQNPLHQNYKHTKVIESLLGLNENQIFSVVVFVGDSTFKTEMPENVTYGKGYIRFIKSKKQPILTGSEVESIKNKIETGRLVPSFKTDLEHVKHVKTIVAEKENYQKCSKCGNAMAMREVKRGQNVGKKFWGCSKFPKCRGIVNVT